MTEKVITAIQKLEEADLENNQPYKIHGANGNLYSAFRKMPDKLEQGQVVQIEYKVNDKGYKNIKEVEVQDEKTGETQSKPATRQQSILVTASYKNAMKPFEGKGLETDWAKVRQEARKSAKHMKETLEEIK